MLSNSETTINCGYCDPWSNSYLVSQWGLSIQIKRNYLECHYGSGVGPHSMSNYITKAIKYCPMCGRKL